MGKTLRRTRYSGNRKVRETEAKALTPTATVLTEDDALGELVEDLVDFAEFIGLEDQELMQLLPPGHGFIHAGGR